MKTERKLVLALKTMMAKTPLEEITVTTLSNKCRINRQTFYYHFHDIYDLLTLLFLNEKIEHIESAKNAKEMVTLIYQYYEDNEAFVEATIKSAGKDLFEEFIFNTCYQCFTRYVDFADTNNKVNRVHRKNIIRYYASAFSSLIVNYLETTKTKSLNGLLSCFDFLAEGEVARSVQVLIQKDIL